MSHRSRLIELWEEACATGMAHTAHGILLDLFHVWDLLEISPHAPEIADRRAMFKEAMMHMIGDDDGQQFHSWRQLWLNDREAFDERAFARIEACID